MKDHEKIEAILKLADLGFSRVEIEKILSEKPEKEPVSNPTSRRGLMRLAAH